ncbi:MAG TPA: hypothetical protein VN205_07475 [Thermomonas sp.]|nr:hypothetical protein [Thermomonas sp.]
MPRTKKPVPAPAPLPAPAAPVVPPSKTSHLFSSRKPAERNAITHERIAADLEAFYKAGGEIEMLGVTRSLKKIDGGNDDTPAPAPAKPRR